MFTRTFQQHLAMAAATALTVFTLNACLAPTAPSVPVAPTAVAAPVAPVVLGIVAKDYSFEAPKEIAGGWVTVAFKNEGKQPHHAQLVRLNDDVTAAQFQAALPKGIEAVMPLITMPGGPGVVDSNNSQETTIYLKPGHYFLICLVPDEKGMPHLAHGMIAPLEVTANSHQTATEPQADAEVKLVDFSFALPATIKPGAQTWKITAASKQPHEMALVKLAEGKTMMDVMAWMQQPVGAPPFSNVGGMQAMMPGDSGYLHLNLTAGDYIAICHVPDAASGKEHAALGMMMPFKVQS
ncbi:MAG: hypothetical protein NT075_34965 [Chloroflexi bacterium]|nr:hypothetical protein [Chloroflexota bacterium]